MTVQCDGLLLIRSNGVVLIHALTSTKCHSRLIRASEPVVTERLMMGVKQQLIQFVSLLYFA